MLPWEATTIVCEKFDIIDNEEAWSVVWRVEQYCWNWCIALCHLLATDQTSVDRENYPFCILIHHFLKVTFLQEAVQPLLIEPGKLILSLDAPPSTLAAPSLASAGVRWEDKCCKSKDNWLIWGTGGCAIGNSCGNIVIDRRGDKAMGENAAVGLQGRAANRRWRGVVSSPSLTIQCLQHVIKPAM